MTLGVREPSSERSIGSGVLTLRWSARAAMWAFLAVGLLAVPFLSLPGKYVFDSRDPIWLNPGRYMAKALTLWASSPHLGQQQHDGIVFPMGVVIWTLRSIGLSAWATERVWHGFLLFACAGSTVLFVDHALGRRTVVAPMTAGLLYALTPYAFGYGLQFTGVFLPYVLLPLLLLVTSRGMADRSLRWAALFGLTTFLMGGGNGAPQAYALLVAFAFMAWIALVEHRASFAEALRFGGTCLLFVAGLNAYWLFLLGSREVGNALAFSEQPHAINVSSSASETIRGLGYWQFYGGDPAGPWIPAVRDTVTSIPLILAGYAIAVAALASAWLARWRYRLFFVLLLVVATFVGIGIFPPSSPTPFGRFLLFAYRHVPGFAGLRTTYKALGALDLSVALLAGIGLGTLWERLAFRARPNRARLLAAAAAVLLLAASSYPAWSGKLYRSDQALGAIPRHWQSVLRYLDGRENGYRAFFAPATNSAVYRWGGIRQGVVAADQDLASVAPLRLPVGEGYGTNLLAAIEQPYLAGRSAAGTAQLLRYLGVRDVVLQDDLDAIRSQTANAQQLSRLREDQDLVPQTRFGSPPDDVRVLGVADPATIVQAQAGDPVVLSGDGYGLANLARDGLLPKGAPVLYSGTLSPAQLQDLIRDAHPSFVITDTNRRVVWSFTSPRGSHSATLRAGETLPESQIGYGLFGDRAETQSTAVEQDLASVSASSYGSVFGFGPQFRPANAFDGDPRTSWLTGIGGDATGAWIQATFVHPLRLTEVRIATPSVPWLRGIAKVQLEFSAGPPVISALGSHDVDVQFASRSSSFLRVRILQLGPGPTPQASGAGVSEFTIPGVQAAEVIRVPDDLFQLARETTAGPTLLAGVPLRYLFDRARNDTPGIVDEEASIDRTFEVPATASFTVTGSGHLGPGGTDDQIDQLAYGPRDVHVTSSSRFLDDPKLRGSAAFDGSLGTGWVPTHAQGEWLRLAFPSRIVDHLVVRTATGAKFGSILGVRATFSDGSVVSGAPSSARDGVIRLRFPARATSSVTITIDQVLALPGQASPVSIREVEIPGLSPLRADRSSPASCLDTSYSVDGRPLSVRPVGSVDQLLAGHELALATCDGAALTLDAGWHTLRAGGAFQPDTISLATGQPTGSGSVAPPAIAATPRSDGGFRVSVTGATAPYYLVIGQNIDPGWRARLDGTDLGPALLLDGYSAGWRVDRPGSYVVEVSYAPQRQYDLLLLVSAVSLLLALAVVWRGSRRARARRTIEVPDG